MEYNSNNILKIEYIVSHTLFFKSKKRWKSNICFKKYTLLLLYHPIFLISYG